jgi:dihydrofolate reductase
MRTVIYGAACSLDGFITGPKGELDWLHMTPEVGRIIAETWSRIDVMLMGRKTWEVGQSMGGGPAAPGITTYLFSRTLKDRPPAGVELVSENAGEFVRTLKKKKGKDILVMGGGELGQSLFEAGVIDEVGLNIHPVLLGSGAPLFRDAGHRIKLKLEESRVLEGGCVLATYRVRR